MVGVEFLASKEVATAYLFNWTACWISFGIVFVPFLIFIIRDFVILKDFIALLVFGICIAFIVGMLSGAIFNIGTDYKMEHKVLISKDVSMVEFLEKYKVVDVEGKIYTIREK